jgi:hypothetical protein
MSKTKTNTYEYLLSLGKEATEAVKRPFKVRAAKNKLKGEIIELESTISDLDLKLAEAKSSDPFDLTSVLTAINNKELKERELKLANELMKELFP